MLCFLPPLEAVASLPTTVTLAGLTQVGGLSGSVAVGLIIRFAVCLRLILAVIRPILARTLAIACFISHNKEVFA